LRIIKNIRIVSGSHPFIEIPGRWAYVKAYYDYPKAPRKDPLPTDTSKPDMYAVIPLHFGLNPLDKFDPTAVIPAKDLSSLQLQILWGSAGDVADNFSIDAADITVTIYELKELPVDKKVVPEVFTQDIVVDAAYSGLGFQVGIQNDKVLGQLYMIQTDGFPPLDANRTNAVVTEFAFFDNYRNEEIFRITWQQELEDDRKRYNKDPLDGVAILDPVEIIGAPLFYTGERSNTYALKMTTTTTGGLVLVYFGYAEWPKSK